MKDRYDVNQSDESRISIQHQWIDFCKSIKDDEFPNLFVSDEQYEWFGENMWFLTDEFAVRRPGSEDSRKYPIGFLRLLEGESDSVMEEVSYYQNDNYGEWKIIKTSKFRL